MAYNPSIKPARPFNPNGDADILYKAMKGFGTDENALIAVLCNRTWEQRKEIALAFKTSYGKDLVKEIESETSGNFEKLLVNLLTDPQLIEAQHLEDSIKGIGTNEKALIDCICTKNNFELNQLKISYKKYFNKNLEKEVENDVSGNFKRFLVSLMACNRSNAPADKYKAVQQAKELYDAGEGKWGTNEVVFNRIFCQESFEHLGYVFDEYHKLVGHPIEKAISSEMSGSVELAFLALVQMVRNPAGYYAQRLYESMKGMGTNDILLIRMMVLRSEIDMESIKIEFQKKYGESLESFIKGDTSGDYRIALLCLAGIRS